MKATLFLPVLLGIIFYSQSVNLKDSKLRVQERALASEGSNCTSAISAFINTKANSGESLNEVLGLLELSPAEASALRGYWNSVPSDLQERLLTKFRSQSKEATLKDLKEMLDLYRINGTCG